MEDNGTIDNTDSGTNNNTDNGTTPETKSLPTGENNSKSLDVGEDSGKELEEGEDPHKTLPTRDHETKKINESSHETKANDEAYEEPKEEVKADLFNLDYFDKPEEAPQEVTEKASELINGDLNYFDNWIAEAEDQKKQNKEQLESYLKSNVESGNQLAYTQEDLNEAQRNLQSAEEFFEQAVHIDKGNSRDIGSPLNEIFFDNLRDTVRDDLTSGAFRNITSKEEALQKIREEHPICAANIANGTLNAWADSIVTHNKQRQIQEDMGRNGPTVNRGISKAQETALLDKAIDDWDSLSDTEKEMAGRYLDAFGANPHDPAFGGLNIPEPATPFETPRDRRAREERNRAREERSIRDELARDAIRTGRAVDREEEAERREAERARETPETPTRTTPEPTRTESVPETPSEPEVTPETPTTETPAEETSTTESETPESESTETPETEVTPEASDDEIIAKADEAKAAYEEVKRKEYEAMRGEADETEIAQLAAEAERLRQEWEEAEAEAADLRPREDEVEDGEESPKEPRIGHGREDRELSKEETLPEWVGGDDPHTSSAGAYWAGAFGDENWSDKVPPKAVQGLIDYANDHHDNPFAMFGMTALMEAGGYDALKAGRDVQDMIASAKEVAANANKAIDYFKNGSVLDGIKSILSAGWSVLKVLGNTFSAAWNVCKSAFSFLRSIFAPLSSAVSSFLNTVNGYNSVKAMIRDMYGIENTDEVIGEIFGDNSETNTKQSPVNVLNKTGFSVKGGTVTDESGYNKGMKEKENEIASDVCKKTMLYFPYLRKAIRK